MPEFTPCPFCGAEISARLYSEVTGEGDEDTIDKFVIVHGKTDQLCPIEHHDREYLGTILYDSPDEAAEIWNTRRGLDDT